jgi:hypothetical protein
MNAARHCRNQEIAGGSRERGVVRTCKKKNYWPRMNADKVKGKTPDKTGLRGKGRRGIELAVAGQMVDG